MFPGAVTTDVVNCRGGELLSGRKTRGSGAQRRPGGGEGGAKVNEMVSVW